MIWAHDLWQSRRMTYWECLRNAVSPNRPGRTIFLVWLFGTKPEDKWDVVGRIVLGGWYFGTLWLLASFWRQL